MPPALPALPCSALERRAWRGCMTGRASRLSKLGVPPVKNRHLKKLAAGGGVCHVARARVTRTSSAVVDDECDEYPRATVWGCHGPTTPRRDALTRRLACRRCAVGTQRVVADPQSTHNTPCTRRRTSCAAALSALSAEPGQETPEIIKASPSTLLVAGPAGGPADGVLGRPRAVDTALTAYVES